MSGLFRGSQINWACLTKEAYAIYMSIKKLAYYLQDAGVILRSVMYGGCYVCVNLRCLGVRCHIGAPR